VEWLTDRLAEDAERYIAEVDARGGAVAAVESGYIQREIQEAAYRYQQQIEAGERTVVGVNRFQEAESGPPRIATVDPGLEQAQCERVRRLRASRDAGRVEAALRRVEDAARGSDNLLPPLLQAVEAYATLGEMAGVLRRVFGQYRPPVVL
jgi:methylmalonyl-CoA mutase N-terminal domain/subunit